MPVLTDEISQAWEEREGPIVLTTVDPEGVPNAIYASSVRKYDDKTLIIADNYFNKTRANILSGSKGSLLFITKDGKSYQIKGVINYHTEGPLYDDMKSWNRERLPGVAAASLKVEQVYSGAEQLV